MMESENVTYLQLREVMMKTVRHDGWMEELKKKATNRNGDDHVVSWLRETCTTKPYHILNVLSPS